MNHLEVVQLAVYDLSRGVIKSYASSLLGIEVEAIYHTGVRVYGYEYFFSNGIQRMTPEDVELYFNMVPLKIIPMGGTEVPEEIIDSYISENDDRYSEKTYDLLYHNCNNFSDELVFFLTSNHIPQEILDLPNKLLSTSLGQKIVPMLETWGVTKATPFATTGHASRPNLAAYNSRLDEDSMSESTMDFSSMRIWMHNHMDEALTDVRQFCRQRKQETVELEKCCLYLYDKAIKRELSFLGIKKATEIVAEKAKDPQWEDALFKMLVLLIQSLEMASGCVSIHGIHSESFLCSVCRQFKQLSMDVECPESLREMSLISLATLCSSATMVDLLQKQGDLANLLNDMTLDMSVKKEVRVIYAAIMSNMCAGVHVSCEGCDASDECIMLLNKLSEGIFEEPCKEVLDQRICGLYLLLKRGGATELLMVQAQGIGKESSPAIRDCDVEWNELIRLISDLSFIVCFLTESALIPKKSKEIKVDKSIVVGLKSVIAQQERKQDEEEFSLNPRKRTRKVTNPKSEKKSDRNPGIDERIRRDEEEVKSDSMKEKLRKLEEKAELFHKMQRGEVEIDEENTMIDFNRRKQMFEFYDIPMRTEDVKKEDPPLIDGVRDRYYEMLNSPHKPDEVLIEDEFGRLRWVKHGSVDHMNNIGSSYRIRKQMQGGLQDVDERKPTSKAAKVKMTWENRLQGSERDYFVEIDKKTEEIRKKKLEQKEQTIQKPERTVSRSELAEDILRSLL